MKVRIKSKTGFLMDKRVRQGEEHDIPDDRFDESWMERLVEELAPIVDEPAVEPVAVESAAPEPSPEPEVEPPQKTRKPRNFFGHKK